MRKRGRHLLALEVPGLAERRPSLVHGDHVFAMLASHQGITPYRVCSSFKWNFLIVKRKIMLPPFYMEILLAHHMYFLLYIIIVYYIYIYTKFCLIQMYNKWFLSLFSRSNQYIITSFISDCVITPDVAIWKIVMRMKYLNKFKI